MENQSEGASREIRILVAEDFLEWRIRIRSILQAVPEWKIVFEASDGAEAVEKAAELRPDIVVLDVALPRLNGIEVAKRIRQDSPESKVIFFTTNNIPGIETAALAMGAAAYVQKKNASTELIPAIALALHDCPLELTV